MRHLSRENLWDRGYAPTSARACGLIPGSAALRGPRTPAGWPAQVEPSARSRRPRLDTATVPRSQSANAHVDRESAPGANDGAALRCGIERHCSDCLDCFLREARVGEQGFIDA